jgi:hypothetical protein
MEKYLNCPFRGTSADGVRVVLYSQIFPHAPCVLLWPVSQLFMLIKEITLRWWRMHFCQYVYIPFVIPHYGCQVMSQLSPYVAPLQFYFLSKILWHPFLFGLTFPQHLIVVVCKSSMRETKINCTYLLFVPHCQV